MTDPTEPLTYDEITNIRANLAEADQSVDPWEAVPNYRAVSGLLAEADRLRTELVDARTEYQNAIDAGAELVATTEQETKKAEAERDALGLKLAETAQQLHAEQQTVEALKRHLASGEASDGYHTHNELYEYRMLYNAHAARGWLEQGHHVVKSYWHRDGELCFGGGWFIVVAELPTGQVSNHYREEYWGLFDVPELMPPVYDGHTPAEAAERLRAALGETGGTE